MGRCAQSCPTGVGENGSHLAETKSSHLRNALGVLTEMGVKGIKGHSSYVINSFVKTSHFHRHKPWEKEIENQGFPGGAVVESLPANAGDAGSSPGLGRSHVPRSSWAHEPQLLSLRVWSLCSATREAVIVRGPRTVMKSGPRLPQLEKALAQKRRPNTARNK